MNNTKQEDNLVLLCAMCQHVITSYTVEPREFHEHMKDPRHKGFICDDCYMLNVEPDGMVQ